MKLFKRKPKTKLKTIERLEKDIRFLSNFSKVIAVLSLLVGLSAVLLSSAQLLVCAIALILELLLGVWETDATKSKALKLRNEQKHPNKLDSRSVGKEVEKA